MPQHLFFEVDGEEMGHLSTSNKGGTLYDVVLQGGGFEPIRLTGVDTGIHRQPQDVALMQEDFRNDFVHARRVLAAAAVTAGLFRQHLAMAEAVEGTRAELMMRLRTNAVDRGEVRAKTTDDGSGETCVELVIGTGPKRPPGAVPEDPVMVAQRVARVSIDATGLNQCLEILEQVGPDFVTGLTAAIEE